MKTSNFSKDILEFLSLLYKYSVKYLIIGGEAVIYYGHVRLTGDIDLYYENTPENVDCLFKTLKEFWGGSIPGIERKEELAEPGIIVQFGVPPNRIDLLNKITGVNFPDAWQNRKTEKLKIKKEFIEIYYIGLNELIKNKKALKRPRDLEDLRYLKTQI